MEWLKLEAMVRGDPDNLPDYLEIAKALHLLGFKTIDGISITKAK